MRSEACDTNGGSSVGAAVFLCAIVRYQEDCQRLRALGAMQVLPVIAALVLWITPP